MSFRDTLLDAINRITNVVQEAEPGSEDFVPREELLEANVVPGIESFIPKAGPNAVYEEIVRTEGDFYYGDLKSGIYDEGERILVLAEVEMGHFGSVIQLWPYYFRRVS